MAIQSYKEILTWQKAHRLALDVYKLTKLFPKCEEFVLIGQIRRCAISVASNIVEGFARKSLKDSKRFYIIAEGSLEELKYQLLLAKDLGYLTLKDFDTINESAEEVSKLLSSWKKSQRF
jgi:four helix bundle protein